MIIINVVFIEVKVEQSLAAGKKEYRKSTAGAHLLEVISLEFI